MSSPISSPIAPVRAARIARERRSFLRSVGKAAAALPFYRLLESSAVLAADDQPQRFITFYYPHGIASPLFNKQSGDTETTFSLTYPGSVLAPLEPYKSKLNIIEGIDLAAGVERNTNGHDASCIILSGCAPQGEKVANESLDQFLAVTKGLGSKTRLASLVLGVGNKDTASGRNLSYSKTGAPISKLINPAETYKLVFADLVVGNDPSAKAGVDKKVKRGQAIIDNVRAEVNALNARLAGPEKLKLEQHLSSLRDLEKRLQGLSGGAGGGGGPVMACSKPPAPNAATDFPKVEYYNGGKPYLDKICDLQIDFIVQAMACDITRFATLFYFLTEEVHNMVAHQYRPQAPEALAKDNLYYFEKLARLLGGLQKAGILDSTLVYMTSDMGDPNMHSVKALPTVLAGGLNGKLKTGRRLVAKQGNNKLLTSIANLFGAGVDGYGVTMNAATSKGGLAELG
jgi:hypothetical protein